MVQEKKWPIAATIVILVAVAAAVILLRGRTGGERPLVGVIEPLQHVAVADITRGVKDGLGDCCEVVVKNASTETTTIPQLIAHFKDRGVDIFVPIFTQTAQVVKAAVAEQQIVFAAVTDPVKAGLLSNLNAPEGNVTGVSDLWPVGSTLGLVRRVLPEARTIGLVYNPGDPNAESTLAVLRQEATQRDFALKLKPVHASSEISAALEALGGDIDLLFTANDVTVTAALPALVTHAIDRQIPLFAGDYSTVERGAIGGVGQNYYEVGLAAGKAVRELVDGTPVSEIPVVFTTGGDVFLNKFAAEQMGVTIPEEVLQEATQVYHEIAE